MLILNVGVQVETTTYFQSVKTEAIKTLSPFDQTFFICFWIFRETFNIGSRNVANYDQLFACLISFALQLSVFFSHSPFRVFGRTSKSFLHMFHESLPRVRVTSTTQINWTYGKMFLWRIPIWSEISFVNMACHMLSRKYYPANRDAFRTT